MIFLRIALLAKSRIDLCVPWPQLLQMSTCSTLFQIQASSLWLLISVEGQVAS